MPVYLLVSPLAKYSSVTLLLVGIGGVCMYIQQNDMHLQDVVASRLGGKYASHNFTHKSSCK